MSFLSYILQFDIASSTAMSKGLGVYSSGPSDWQTASLQTGTHADQGWFRMRGMGTITGTLTGAEIVKVQCNTSASVGIEDLSKTEFSDFCLHTENDIKINIEKSNDNESEDKVIDCITTNIGHLYARFFTVPKAEKNKTKPPQSNKVLMFQDAAYSYYKSHIAIIVKFLIFVAFLGYTIFFISALIHSVEGAKALIILTILAVVIFIYNQVKDNFGRQIYKYVWRPANRLRKRVWPCLRW